MNELIWVDKSWKTVKKTPGNPGETLEFCWLGFVDTLCRRCIETCIQMF